MYRKLQEDTLQKLLEAGIDEFAEHGLDRANINTIAKKAGVSVGVIYKYYEDKDRFFLACVEHALEVLESVLTDVTKLEGSVQEKIRLLVKDLMDVAQEHPNYFRMYNEVTSGSCRKYANELAEKIETATAQAYAELFSKGQENLGNARSFAFFFDNLLMMLQYSFSCDYYRRRMEIFCGDDIEQNKDQLADAFVAFACNALQLS